MEGKYPTSVDAAVRLLLKTVEPEEQAKMPSMPRDGLFLLQFSVGTWIRRNMGLYEGNDLLIRDSGETDIDLVCMTIICALWTHLCIHGVVNSNESDRRAETAYFLAVMKMQGKPVTFLIFRFLQRDAGSAKTVDRSEA